MEWIETPESSRILRIRYNEGEENTVDVEFSSHEIYRYFDVPLKVWDEFVANPSKGRYVNVGLRPFRYKKIQPTPKAEPQQQPPPEE